VELIIRENRMSQRPSGRVSYCPCTR